MGSATLTLKEAFATAFTEEADVLLTLVGVPDKASLTVMHVQPDTMRRTPPRTAADVTDITNSVTLNDDTDDCHQRGGYNQRADR